MKSNTIISDLICGECGSVFSIPRYTSNIREKYHIKDIYCPTCKKVTKYIEVRNLDLIKRELEFKEELTEIEKLVYRLTHENSNKRL